MLWNFVNKKYKMWLKDFFYWWLKDIPDQYNCNCDK